MNHAEHCAEEPGGCGIVGGVRDERTVNLHDIEWIGAQRAERRVAGSKIIEREPHAKLLERTKHARRAARVAGDARLSHL